MIFIDTGFRFLVATLLVPREQVNAVLDKRIRGNFGERGHCARPSISHARVYARMAL